VLAFLIINYGVKINRSSSRIMTTAQTLATVLSC